MDQTWETELAQLLRGLTEVQDDVLDVLAKKRDCIVSADLAGMQALQAREQEVIDRLQRCQSIRAELLRRAGEEGLPSESLLALSSALPAHQRAPLTKQMNETAGRLRLLRHQSLANWVLVQRTLLHLSQLLELIATGGRMRTTYGAVESDHASGALVDRAA